MSMGCGDGCRDAATEECDDGNSDETLDACDNDCRVRDLLLVSQTKPEVLSAQCDHFVVSTTQPTGDGTLQKPWDLNTALVATASISAGDVVCLRAGTYGTGGSQIIIWTIAGATDNRVVLRSFPGERAVIDGTLQVTGDWVEVRDLTVMNSDTARISTSTAQGASDINRGIGIDVNGASNVNVINTVVHDTGYRAIRVTAGGSDAMFYGNISFNNGWEHPSGGWGDGFFVKGADNFVENNFTSNNFDKGMHISTVSDVALKNNQISDDLIFGNLASGTNRLEQNSIYGYSEIGQNGANSVGIVIDGNTFVENDVSEIRKLYFRNWQEQEVKNNLLYSTQNWLIFYQQNYAVTSADWHDNHYYYTNTKTQPFREVVGSSARNFTEWQTISPQYDVVGSTYTAAAPTGVQVRVYPNAHEAKRAHVSVFNWDKDPFVDLDLSTVGFEAGDQIEIWNMHNLCGDPPLVQIYDPNKDATIPMNGWTTADAIGYDGTNPFDEHRNPHPDYGAFLVTSGKFGTLCGTCANPLEPTSASVRLCPNERRLGDGRHQASATETGWFGVTYLEFAGGEPSVQLASFDEDGVPFSRRPIDEGTTPLYFSNPVIAGLSTDSVFAAAWTDLNGDGDQLGVAMRLVTLGQADLGAVEYANESREFSQFDPDIIWTGSEIVVAWVDDTNLRTAPDIRYRTFDEDLKPTSGEQDLAAGPEVDADVALTTFDGSWAAIWRSASNQGEKIEAVAGSVAWEVGPFPPPPAIDVPAVAELDSTHLLVVYTQGTDPLSSGVENTPRLRGAVLDVASPGPVIPFAIDPLVTGFTDPSFSQSQPAVVNVDGDIYIAWRSENRAAGLGGEELWIKPVAWDSMTDTLTLTTTELRFQRDAVHADGDQRRPVLAASNLAPSGAIVAAWTDFGRTLGTGQGSPDIGVQLMPNPLIRIIP